MTKYPSLRTLRGCLRAICLPWFGYAWLIGLVVGGQPAWADRLVVLHPIAFAHYVEHFNTMEDENVTNAIPNAQAWTWLQAQIPFWDCPDESVVELYYYRWWSFRKHIEATTNGYVLTEFLTKPQPISSALGFHLAEGRWLQDQALLDDYVRYWLRDEKTQQQLHKYSSWLATALWQRGLVTGHSKALIPLLPALVADYRQWEAERQTANGLFWQYDVRDAMEESISGSRTNKNLRPSINSYMYGNARAIAQLAELAGDPVTAKEFETKARELKQGIENQLWNGAAGFFEVKRDDGQFSGVREEIGFIPWMFGLAADTKFSVAWGELTNELGFAAPAGITTAERRHPQFRTHGVGHCEWDGAVWPFATSQTLYALANYLRSPAGLTGSPAALTQQDYFRAFQVYTRVQHADGKPYIGEYLDEKTGAWINGKGGRSRYYNHSTYADLIITGLVGLEPVQDAKVVVKPLLPAAAWEYFCLDGLPYHGHSLTLLWDRDGQHYGQGQGFSLWADGKVLVRNEALTPMEAKLP